MKLAIFFLFILSFSSCHNEQHDKIEKTEAVSDCRNDLLVYHPGDSELCIGGSATNFYVKIKRLLFATDFYSVSDRESYCTIIAEYKTSNNKKMKLKVSSYPQVCHKVAVNETLYAKLQVVGSFACSFESVTEKFIKDNNL